MVTNPTSVHGDSGSIPGLTQWVKGSGAAVSCNRLQGQLRSGVAVAMVQIGSCSSDLTPSL